MGIPPSTATDPSLNLAATGQIGQPQPGQTGQGRNSTGPGGLVHATINPGAAGMTPGAAIQCFTKPAPTLISNNIQQSCGARLRIDMGLNGAAIYDGIAKCAADANAAQSQKFADANMKVSQGAADANMSLAQGAAQATQMLASAGITGFVPSQTFIPGNVSPSPNSSSTSFAANLVPPASGVRGA